MTPSLDFQWPEEAQALARSARRIETPCGNGQMIWHVWDAAQQRPKLAPLVLLHGGSGSWMHWLQNIPALVASGRPVLVPDLPGFGDSAIPVLGTDADVLPELVEQGLQMLIGDAACDLVGFSFGGMVAGFLAERYAARAARVVLVGAPGLGVTPERAVRLRAWRHLEDPQQRDAIHRHNLAALMLFQPEAITGLALQLHVANVMRDRMKGRRLARTDALAQSLARVKCPAYAIYGREDALYRGKADALEAALAQACDFRGLTWIEAAGHWVQFEQPEAFDDKLLMLLETGR